jgi:CDP-2,3-bis-(O-geranylgeranyl)-sn-glycerol synthase
VFELDLLKLTAYLLPMYVTNASAVFFAGQTQLDFGVNLWDKRPVFGKGKTIRGTAVSFLAGVFVALVISRLFTGTANLLGENYFALGILLSLGTVIGDLVASFFKRRANIESGKEVMLVDQLDFTVGAIVFGAVYYVPSLVEIGFIVIATLLLHRLTNLFAFKIKLKKVPW